MINSKQLFQDFISQLDPALGEGEILSIAYLTFEKLFNIQREQLIAGLTINLNDNAYSKLSSIVTRINNHEPIQYILKEAYFFGRMFYVDANVLIPRPETEELVALTIDHAKHFKHDVEIVDIGTGSGCIAISLALELPGTSVSAVDKSVGALQVAQRNSAELQAKVKFAQLDILHQPLPGQYDIIVSNPPYILQHERTNMSANVTAYEPSLALFVEDDRPLIFYEAIAANARSSLKANGFVAVEINEKLGKETTHLFTQEGFNDTFLVKDISGKDRFVVARRN